MSNDRLRLDRLVLHNFRCFEKCTLDLHPEMTVLVADNGHGKTALLDAIGIALGSFIDAVSLQNTVHRLTREDVRITPNASGSMHRATSTQFHAVGVFRNTRVTWGRALRSGRISARNTTKDTVELAAPTAELYEELRDFSNKITNKQPTFPLVVFYGTGRLWSTHRLTIHKIFKRDVAVDRLLGYTDCLSPSSSFNAFVHWYGILANALRHGSAAALGPDERPEKMLAAVRAATKTVLEPTGWRDIDWDFTHRELVAEHPQHGKLPLRALSDGVRNMVALVADMAHRCARLNPHFGEDAALKTPGIALIDEVDMHLHPKWQQRILELLQRAFPAVQFVVSTHSPQVLSTVDKDCIRVIRVRDGEATLETPRFQTRGVESADVLSNIMGVDPVPQVEEARLLSTYRGLIEDGQADAPEAQELRARLLEHFGVQHPLMVDCDRLIRFQALKIRRNAAREVGS
jgi:predicted ATP-binding protein involved in virulence